MTPSTIESVRSTSPPKSAWPGCVDDVDEVAVVVDGRVLGQNRDAPLALELVRVHHPLGHALVGAKQAALPQQRVDERGLAVIDVGDDRHVAKQGIGDRLWAHPVQ